MRESFVFHRDYIEDLPDRHKAEFIRATINYGLYGENPPFEDGTLEMSLWAKIARRIDAETERYKAISEKRKEAAQRRYQQWMAKTTRKEPTATEEPAETGRHAEKAKKADFIKPTVEEVEAYCKERGNGLDARTFFDFYESKGWKVGAARMRDWRACVRTWERRKKTESTGGRTGAIWGGENEVSQDIVDMI